MRAREFAEQVLRAPTLEGKLRPPPAGLIFGERSESVSWLGDDPVRPPEFALRPGVAQKPSRMAFDTERGRLQLLHAFANHELQALELMALALLRFADAPVAFRRGLVQTLAEEQRHLGLYLRRIDSLGGVVGEFPCSDSFWRFMAPQTQPAQFVAAMALTFEQANLDYAAYYAERFAQAGDLETRDVLETVLEDEIGHVAFGLRWFQRWQPSGESLFDGHMRCLAPPLQVVRAKGLGFQTDARRKAGLPPDYIDEVHRAGGSKGALPVLRWFNPTAEHEVAGGLGYTPSAAVRAAVRDLDGLMIFGAAGSDIVVMHRPPTPEFLEQLVPLGLPAPRFIEADPFGAPLRLATENEALGGLQPWGASPRAASWSALVRPQLGPRGHDGARFTEGHRRLYDKVTALACATTLATDEPEGWWIREDELGGSHRSVRSVTEAVAGIASRHVGPIAIKAPLGTAGRSMIRVIDGEFSAPQRGWVASTLRQQGSVVVEPWLDRIADLSFRLTVDHDGARVDDVGRFLTDHRGQYRGAIVGPPTLGLSSVARRALAGDGRDAARLRRAADRVAAVVGEVARACGYVGPVGVDGLLYRRGDEIALRPVVEINPRLNMGHLAAQLRRRVASGRAALWAWMRRADVEEAGYPDFASWWAVVGGNVPVLESRGGRGRITGGVVATTDPLSAAEVVTVLVVGDTLEACAELIGWRGLQS